MIKYKKCKNCKHLEVKNNTPINYTICNITNKIQNQLLFVCDNYISY